LTSGGNYFNFYPSPPKKKMYGEDNAAFQSISKSRGMSPVHLVVYARVILYCAINSLAGLVDASGVALFMPY